MKNFGKVLGPVGGILVLLSGCSGEAGDGTDLGATDGSPAAAVVADSAVESAADEAIGTSELALSGTDVGVILDGGANCPGGKNVEMYLDDEDDDNNNQRSGWFGQFSSARNTALRFCRVSGSQFKRVKSSLASANYAVLQLGASCPSGSFSATRYFDNEDNACGVLFPRIQACGTASEYSKGDIAPSVFGGRGGNNLTMKICVFDANNTSGSTTPFPELGFSYGVLGSAVPGAKATGYVYTDNEDDNNNNSVSGFPPNFDYSAIMTTSHKNGGTKLFTVRVK